MREVPIWDLPTRVFHWSLAAAVALCYATGGDEGRWFAVHLLSGYAIAALLAFRLLWGFVGSPRSRFGDFLRGWPAVREYAGTLVRLRPEHFVGHNPLGGWMVAAMILVLLASVSTGLVSGEPGEAAGPLLGVIVPVGFGEAVAEGHELLGNLVLALAVVHVAAVLLDWALTGENLIPAMVHGRKRLDDAAAARERPLAGSGRGLALAVAVAALLALAIQQTNFKALAGAGDGPERQSAQQPGEEDHDED